MKSKRALLAKSGFFFYTRLMPVMRQALLMTSSVITAYVFLQVPALGQYSLQLFALLFLIYWLLQRRSQRRLFYPFAQQFSANILLLNMAFMLLIGGSGGLSSPWFVLTFIQLFFVALACSDQLAILLSLQLVLFYLGLGLNIAGNLTAMTMTELSNLLAVPLVMLFYLFGKNQYQKAHYQTLLLDSEKQERLQAQADDQAVADFIHNLLDKRLPMLEYWLTFTPAGQSTIQDAEQLAQQQALQQELATLKIDLQALIREIDRQRLIDGQTTDAVQESEAVMEAMDADSSHT